MPESVASLAPAGAARMVDLIWPGRLTAAGGGGVPAPLDTSHTGRNRSENFSGTIVGIGPASTNPVTAVRLGVPCAQFNVDGTSGTLFRFYPAMGFTFKAGTPAYFYAQPVVNLVTRVVWMFCGSGIAPAAGNDFGLEFVRAGGAGSWRILTDVNDGWGFRLADANILQFIVRGPNGLVTLNLTGAPFDLTTWHVLDVRIVSAMRFEGVTANPAAPATTEATLTVLLDGQTLNLGALNSSWAAGTNLPAPNLTGGVIGFAPTLMWNPNPINQSYTHQLRFMQAPTMVATL